MQLFWRTLGSMTGAALAVLGLLVVAAATFVASHHHRAAQESVTAAYAHAAVLPTAHLPRPHCQGSGALVVNRHGHVRQVSLVRGLRTYQHKSPGTFLALCPAPTPQGS